MRIIAGRFKKARINSVPHGKTRPTTDFLREMIFSVIQDCEEKRVLDLFAGSGSLGLEALSRGAGSASFVDISENSVKTIRGNIEKLKCSDQSRCFKKKASAFLRVEQNKYDLIFMDPPYDRKHINKTLNLIFESDIIEDRGLIVIEHSHREAVEDKWSIFKIYEKRSGDSSITILQPDRAKFKEISDEDI